MNLRHLGLAACASLALIGMAGPAAATPRAAVTPPPEGAAYWTALPAGLRLIPDAVSYAGTCKGPSGSVWSVGATGGSPVGATVTRVRLSDGAAIAGWTYSSGASGFRPRAAASDAYRNLYVTGERAGKDWLTVKFTRAGAVAWRRPFDSGAGVDTPYALAIDAAGSVVVSGTSASPGGYDALVVKYSPSGAVKWQRKTRTSGRDLLGAIGFDTARNVYVSGSKGDRGTTPGTAVVRSYTPGGRFRWERSAQVVGKSTRFQELRVKGTTVTVAGTAGNAPTSLLLAARYRTDGRGTRVWPGLRQIPPRYSGSWVGGLAVDRSGNVIVSGVAYGYGIPAVDTPIVWKLRGTNGTTLWQKEFSNSAWPHDGEFDAVGVDSAGRIYAGGGIEVSATTGASLLVRYSSGGNPQAMWRTDGPANGSCTFDQVLVLSDTLVLGGARVAGPAGALAGVYRARTVLP